MDISAGADRFSPAGARLHHPHPPPQPQQQPMIYANTINRSASESADNIIKQRRDPLEGYRQSPGCGLGIGYPSWLDGNQSSITPCFESDYFRSPAVNGSGFVDTFG